MFRWIKKIEERAYRRSVVEADVRDVIELNTALSNRVTKLENEVFTLKRDLAFLTSREFEGDYNGMPRNNIPMISQILFRLLQHLGLEPWPPDVSGWNVRPKAKPPKPKKKKKDPYN